MPRPSRAVMAVIAVAVAGLATAGSVLARNSADAPPEEALPAAAAFRIGTCRVIAGPVLAIARLDRTLGTADAVSPADRATLADEQRKLIAARPAAEPGLRGALDGLVTAIGFVRLRVDSHSYDGGVWREADARRRTVQQLCVGAR
ncbi:MAG TPA: hypothetical protein VGO94_04450 [Mycobacteriales bacterium]|nr:hypothetical protein [Mycobacteriales bacterium]